MMRFLSSLRPAPLEEPSAAPDSVPGGAAEGADVALSTVLVEAKVRVPLVTTRTTVVCGTRSLVGRVAVWVVIRVETSGVVAEPEGEEEAAALLVGAAWVSVDGVVCAASEAEVVSGSLEVAAAEGVETSVSEVGAASEDVAGAAESDGGSSAVVVTAEVDELEGGPSCRGRRSLPGFQNDAEERATKATRMMRDLDITVEECIVVIVEIVERVG